MTEEAIKSAGAAARNCGYDLPRSVVRAIVRTYEQAMWRPIEEARRDGSKVDLWCAPQHFSSGPGRVTDCWFSNGRWWRYDEAGDDQCRSEVWWATHYRPLPPPPGKEG